MLISALRHSLNSKSDDLTVDETINVDKTLKHMDIGLMLFKVIWTLSLVSVYCVGVVKATAYEKFDEFLGLLIILWPLSIIGSLFVYKRK